MSDCEGATRCTSSTTEGAGVWSQLPKGGYGGAGEDAQASVKGGVKLLCDNDRLNFHHDDILLHY